MSNNSFDSWNKFLNPDQLKLNLLQSSLFLAGYEILRSSVVERLQDFYTHEWRTDDRTGKLKGIVGEEYRTKVISLHPKDEFHAGCLWFRDSGALTDDDVDIISSIRSHRNYVAHEVTKILASAGHTVNRGMVDNLFDIVKKLDLWWIREVEISLNPDFDHKNDDDIDWDATIGGYSLSLGLIMSLYDGDDRYLRELHEGFVRAWNNRNG